MIEQFLVGDIVLQESDQLTITVAAFAALSADHIGVHILVVGTVMGADIGVTGAYIMVIVFPLNERNAGLDTPVAAHVFGWPGSQVFDQLLVGHERQVGFAFRPHDGLYLYLNREHLLNHCT